MSDIDPDDIKRALANADQPITGVPIDEHGNEMECAEEDHFYTCSACGQAVDMRDLGDVFYHEEPGHKPKPVN